MSTPSKDSATGDASRSARIRVGTSGWSYDDWIGPFYPPGTPASEYLPEYARRFEAVEVDSTFYAVPAARTVELWRDRTPEGFLFAPKVPGSVTHGSVTHGSVTGGSVTGGSVARGIEREGVRVDRVLADEEGTLDAFLERALLLREKLACVLLQFPYFRVKELSPTAFLPRLAATLRRIPEGVRVAVELRNKTWIRGEYLAILREHGAAAVLLDHPYMPPGRAQLELGMTTADFAYIRLLGDRRAIEERTKTWDRVVEDRGERLDAWSAVIEEIAARHAVRSVLAFANNHYAGHAPATCRDLARRLGLGGKMGLAVEEESDAST